MDGEKETGFLTIVLGGGECLVLGPLSSIGGGPVGEYKIHRRRRRLADLGSASGGHGERPSIMG